MEPFKYLLVENTATAKLLCGNMYPPLHQRVGFCC